MRRCKHGGPVGDCAECVSELAVASLPGLPLTTGEGNTAREWAREYDIDCVVCPVCAFTFDKDHVTDATGEYDCPVCECGRLREQLDAARTQLGEVEYGLENLRGWWPDGRLAARQSWLTHIERHVAAVRAVVASAPEGRKPSPSPSAVREQEA